MISKECAYSFKDLFIAAKGRQMTPAEADSFKGLPQEDVNELVINLAADAGWSTRPVRGSDGREYIAFCPQLDR